MVPEKRERPDELPGVSHRIETGRGKIYVNVSLDPETGEPFELFVNAGNSGGYTKGWCEAVGKLGSVALRSGADPDEVADSLTGIMMDKKGIDNGDVVQSIPDAIGLGLRRTIEGEKTIRGDAK